MVPLRDALIAALLLTGPGLQLQGPAMAQNAPATPATPGPAPLSPPVSAPAAQPPSPQQAVLERIRRLRDGDQRRFGNCSYRWDRWKLLADGTRTTTYSCDTPPIVDHLIGVNCAKVQINSFTPGLGRDGKPGGGSWGSWRLPAAGGEELMVATLCANALPQPPAPTTPSATAAPAPRTPATPAAPR